MVARFQGDLTLLPALEPSLPTPGRTRNRDQASRSRKPPSSPGRSSLTFPSKLHEEDPRGAGDGLMQESGWFTRNENKAQLVQFYSFDLGR